MVLTLMTQTANNKTLSDNKEAGSQFAPLLNHTPAFYTNLFKPQHFSF